MKNFNDYFLTESLNEIKSPYPEVFKLYKTSNGLYKRIYSLDFAKNRLFEKITFSIDKKASMLHNLDEAAYYYGRYRYDNPEEKNSLVLFDETLGYYIFGICYSKEEWNEKREIAKLCKNYKEFRQMLDMTDI